MAEEPDDFERAVLEFLIENDGDVDVEVFAARFPELRDDLIEKGWLKPVLN